MAAAGRTPRRSRPRAPRTGPRKDSTTRADILAAATRLFATQGYQATSLRQVAEAVGVDVALIPYYFRNKEGLFAAALELPIDPTQIIEAMFEPGLDGVGERITRTLLGILEDEATRPKVLAVMMAALSPGPDGSLAPDYLENVLLAAYERHLPGPNAARRAALVGTQFVGIALARHVVKLAPIAEMSVEELVEWLAPTIQRYLTD